MIDAVLRINSTPVTSLRVNNLAWYSNVGTSLAIGKPAVEVSSAAGLLKAVRASERKLQSMVFRRDHPPLAVAVKDDDEKEKRPRPNVHLNIRFVVVHVCELDVQSAHGSTVGKSECRTN